MISAQIVECTVRLAQVLLFVKHVFQITIFIKAHVTQIAHKLQYQPMQIYPNAPIAQVAVLLVLDHLKLNVSNVRSDFHI